MSHLRIRFRLEVWLFVCLGFAWIPITRAGSFVPSFPNGVAAGEVSGSSAVLWARTTNLGPLTFTWSTNAAFPAGSAQRVASATDPSQPLKIGLERLDSGATYFYRAADKDGNSLIGTFRTPSTNPDFHGLRFGVSGDWRGELSPYPSIVNAATTNLDFFVALGDTIYADYPSPALPTGSAKTLAEFRAKHAEVYAPRFGLSALADLRASTAMFAVIDDHEVIDNFAGGGAPSSDPRFPGNGAYINESELYRNGVQAFLDYNPILAAVYETPTDLRTHHKPKFYRTQVYGADAAIFLLDTRSFRDSLLPPVANPLDTNAVAQFNALTFDRSPTNGEALPPRTLLGSAQLANLKADLLAAQQRGVLWKVIFIPEPIQNLGFLDASDRFEGYARERADLLKFIATSPISNVLFVTADIHGTLINDVRYRLTPTEPDRMTGAFEVVTGPVAFDRPFGPTSFDFAASVPLGPSLSVLDALLGFEGIENRAAFDALPRAERDRHFRSITDLQLSFLGLDTIGLEGSGIDATLIQGDYVAVHTYGWTAFEIDRESHRLTVTTYGIPPYSPAEVNASILNRMPEVVSQFRVTPKPAATAAPPLITTRVGAAIRLAWAISPPNFVLQVNDRLESVLGWSDEAAASSVVEGQNVVVLMPTSEARFFRLRRK